DRLGGRDDGVLGAGRPQQPVGGYDRSGSEAARQRGFADAAFPVDHHHARPLPPAMINAAVYRIAGLLDAGPDQAGGKAPEPDVSQETQGRKHPLVAGAQGSADALAFTGHDPKLEDQDAAAAQDAPD